MLSEKTVGVPPHVRLEGVTKRFGRLVANDRIDFELQRGEVHALLGENGAGKTTLVGILYGLLVPDEGAIFIDGQRVAFLSPHDAATRGVGMVHQHFMLIPSFTVAENIALGTQTRGRVLLDAQAIEGRIASLSQEFRLQVDPRAKVEDLSVGGQQRVEIIKALNREPSVLILDEPTSVLTPREVGDLFHVLRRLKTSGLAVIFIAHKLDEVMAISDRVTILRDGRVVSTVKTGATTKEALARMMVGRDVSMTVEKSSRAPGPPLLQIIDLEVFDERKTRALDRVSFSVRAGEIFGIAGVAGNGQTELAECITGLRPSHAGRVLLDNAEITDEKPWKLLNRRMAHIPEDRSEQGLAKGLSVAENSILGFHRTRAFCRWGFLNREVRSHAKRLVRDFGVVTPDVETEIRFLSGGNQQKIVLARELHADPRFIVAVQPTRGLDIAATEFVHRRLLRERDRGVGILLVSTDLTEVLSLSDRVGVLHQGKLMDIVSNPQKEVERIGLLMAGSAASAPESGAR